MKLPPVFSFSQLAQVLEMPKKRLWYMLRNKGLPKAEKPRKKQWLTYNDLWRLAPDLYFSLLAAGRLYVEEKIDGKQK